MSCIGSLEKKGDRDLLQSRNLVSFLLISYHLYSLISHSSEIRPYIQTSSCMKNKSERTSRVPYPVSHTVEVIENLPSDAGVC